MSGHCRVMLTKVNEGLALPAVREAMLQAMGNSEDVLDALTIPLDGQMNALAREEFRALPPAFLPNLAAVWEDAWNNGEPFEIVSEVPERPLDAARHGRVEWRMSYDESGAKMIVSHVHGHHAAWFTRPEAVAT